METGAGDYILSPAYDLMNTRIHVNDTDVALKNGLFKNYETESFKANGYNAYDDFFELGRKAGLSDTIIESEVNVFFKKRDEVDSMVQNLFLDNSIKAEYKKSFDDKLKRLAYSFRKTQ